jgi:hypothetical protein
MCSFVNSSTDHVFEHEVSKIQQKTDPIKKLDLMYSVFNKPDGFIGQSFIPNFLKQPNLLKRMSKCVVMVGPILNII